MDSKSSGAAPQINNGGPEFPVALVAETYVTSKANDILEWGYCFKQRGAEDGDCVLNDLVLGEINYFSPDLDAVIQKSFEDNKWRADAVIASAEAQQ